MKTISCSFELQYGTEDGCSECGEQMYAGDMVSFVDGELTCEPCVKEILDSNPIVRKANRVRKASVRRASDLQQ